jgi:hypothetical protein
LASAYNVRTSWTQSADFAVTRKPKLDQNLITRTGIEIDESFRLLISDLETLFKQTFTHKSPVLDGDIRAASVILRKWVCEELITKLCKELGVVPSVPILDNQKVIEAISKQASVTYFLTGGVRFAGRPVMGIYNSTALAMSAPLLPINQMPQKMVKFGKFARQKRVFFEGNYFTCKDIILFTANKLGGVHLDFTRTNRQEVMERAANYMTFGGPLNKIDRKPPGELYFQLEPEGREVLSGFHIEIVAAAASLVSLHIDGKPLIKLETNRGVISRLLEPFRRRPETILHDFKE